MVAVSNKPNKPKKEKGRARETGKTRLMTVELDVELDDALEAFRQRDDVQRTKRAVILMALKEHLARHGAWPIKPS